MVYPIPEVPDNIQPPSSSTEKNSKRAIRKRKRKNAKKARKNSLYENRDRFAVSMSSWAEQFTAAATWQIKHELAYWKAKAVSLEYENKILHDIIRDNRSDAPKGSKTTPKAAPKFDFRSGPVPKMYPNRPETEVTEEETPAEEYEEEHEEHEDNSAGDGNWEVSEEYIEFMMKNAQFKEDARRERELLKAQRAGKSEEEILEAGPSEQKNRSAEMKELYGTNWQKVSALEMSIQSHFMDESDKLKPCHWPNIPFNWDYDFI